MQHENIHVKKGISDLEQEENRPNQKRFEKLLPIVLILIPLLVLGIFMLSDEQNKATSLPQQISEQHEDELEQGQTWEEYLIERWEGRLFGELVRGLVIVQHGNPSYYNNILNLTQRDELIQPKELVFHNVRDGALSLHIFLSQDWNETLEEIMGNWLSVEGAEVVWDGVRTNTNSFTLLLTNLQDEVTITISGLPNIVLTESEPLTFSLGENHWEGPVYLTTYELENGGPAYFADYGLSGRSELIISSSTEYFDLHFSEQMVMESQIGEQWEHLRGEWLTTDSYRVYLDSTRLTQISLDGLFSQSGNHLLGSNKFIGINRKIDSPWVDLETGKMLQISKQASLYDAVRVSPDGKHTLGIEEGWAEFGPGTLYTLFLDQGVNPPLVIADRLYTAVQDNGYPVIWINNEEFLYFSYDQIRLYNVAQNRGSVLFQTEQHKHLQSASYDKARQELHFYIKDEFHVNNTPMIDYYRYSIKERAINQEIKPFSTVAEHDVYNSRSYNVLVNHFGLFKSKLNSAGEQVTKWTTSNGREKLLKGHVLYSFPNGILLQDSSGFDEHLPNALNWWLDSNGSLTELEVIPEAYYIRFGDHLIRGYYNGEHMVMHLFNQNSQTWVELKHHDWSSLPIRNYAHPFIKEEYSNLPFMRELISKSK